LLSYIKRTHILRCRLLYICVLGSRGFPRAKPSQLQPFFVLLNSYYSKLIPKNGTIIL
jgi:hypothetical protein